MAWTSQSGVVGKSIRVKTRQKLKCKRCQRGQSLADGLLLITVAIPGRKNKKQLDSKVPDLVRKTGHQKYLFYLVTKRLDVFYCFFSSPFSPESLISYNIGPCADIFAVLFKESF